MPSIRGGIVAENSAVCRFRGCWPRISSISSAKPMSSISSASSRTSDLKAAQLQRSPVDVVERTPWRRHHDVDATLERPKLPADWLAAVDRQDTRAHVVPVAVHRLGDLHRELARRDEHQGQRLCPPAFREDPLEDGKREGGRLPRPGRGLPDQVTALKQGRDGGTLYRCRLLITEAGERVAQFRGQRQVGEAARTPAVILDHVQPPCSTNTSDSPLVSALGHVMTAPPGRGLIERGGDFPATCHVAATALTSSSATVATDCRRDGHDVGRRHHVGRPMANCCY